MLIVDVSMVWGNDKQRWF